MDSADSELQQLEMTALQSIYGEDFIEVPPPKAWKGAARLNEFIIRVHHQDPDHATKVNMHLHVKFPKTYPRLACATFAIEKPINGVSESLITKLSTEINQEAQKLRGFEMVFTIVTFVQEWLAQHIVPPVEAVGSLALQMKQRAMEEEKVWPWHFFDYKYLTDNPALFLLLHQRVLTMYLKRSSKSKRNLLDLVLDISPPYEKARRLREYEESELTKAKMNRAAEELEEEIRSAALLQQVMAKEGRSMVRRRRAYSDATEVPSDGETTSSTRDDTETEEEIENEGMVTAETMVETYPTEIKCGEASFWSVKLFHPRPACLGLVYLAEPLVDNIAAVIPLEHYVITFEDPYYSTSQGRKKLRQVEQEIRKLINIRHPKLLSIFAVKLVLPVGRGNGVGQLMILSERAPALTLHELLEDCDNLREERAVDYLTQILTALQAIHLSDIVHRGISAHTITLASSPTGNGKTVKLLKTAYHVHLLDLHRSNSFGPSTPPPLVDELQLPDGWLSQAQTESNLVYTRKRDIHDAGIVFMQMLVGLDVLERCTDVDDAIHSARISPTLAKTIRMMIQPSKKSITCAMLLNELSDTPRSPAQIGKIPNWLIDIRTPAQNFLVGSPEMDYFARTPIPPPRTHAVQRASASRWKEDWEELELLGKGGFGSVVKARNKIDGRIYAVKKVRLRTTDAKIFREIDALSRLSHRNIVRYYTTWVETSEKDHSANASDDSSLSGTPTTSAPFSPSSPYSSDGSPLYQTNALAHRTSAQRRKSTQYHPINGGMIVDMDDFDDLSESGASFPSIRFERSRSRSQEDDSSPDEDYDTEDGSGSDSDGSGGLFRNGHHGKGKEVMKASTRPGAIDVPGRAGKRPAKIVTGPTVSRTLYIQMEFVERQTLRELVEEGQGLSENDAWKLFRQIVDALVHMSALGILHRDIKLTNIFIDANGDCKVGDFGLATSSLAAVDPSDVSKSHAPIDADMTLEVGTRLYIAPEVMSRKKGELKNHSKADIYSLGIVFFEMNYPFKTGFERIAVLEDLRKPQIIFPMDFVRHRQREIIKSLLQHDPTRRPTALELSQSPLLPPGIEDEYFKSVLRTMSKPDSPLRQTVVSTLFKHQMKAARSYTYDADAGELSDYASLNALVCERLTAMFHLHGAINVEPPLLIPAMQGIILDEESLKEHAAFMDRQGEVLVLPTSHFQTFARMSAREKIERIKRYHIGNVYRSNDLNHPKAQKVAMFDIITPDIETGPAAATGELITLVNDCLGRFPLLSQNYDIHISHSAIVDAALNRIPAELRSAVLDILRSKVTTAQRRAALQKKGLSRLVLDELEVLSEPDDDIENWHMRLFRASPTLVRQIEPAIVQLKESIQNARSLGTSRPIFFRCFMTGSHVAHFKQGPLIEVVRKNKIWDVLAYGGRYDALISRLPNTHTTQLNVCAMGVEISMDKVTTTIANYHSQTFKSLVKDQHSFGFWSPRRCDVYVISYASGFLQERMDIVALLWQAGISADLMYETGVTDVDVDQREAYALEGILFTVYPRPRSGRGGNLSAFKVRSVLKGTEVDLSRQELVPWLQHHIAEQKRLDATTTGAPQNPMDFASSSVAQRDLSTSQDLHVLLPEAKKRVKTTKNMFTERVFQRYRGIKSAFQSGVPVLAVEVAPNVFDALITTSIWIDDDEAWKSLAAMFTPQMSGYAQSIREWVGKRKGDGCSYVVMYSLKDNRSALLSL